MSTHHFNDEHITVNFRGRYGTYIFNIIEVNHIFLDILRTTDRGNTWIFDEASTVTLRKELIRSIISYDYNKLIVFNDDVDTIFTIKTLLNDDDIFNEIVTLISTSVNESTYPDIVEDGCIIIPENESQHTSFVGSRGDIPTTHTHFSCRGNIHITNVMGKVSSLDISNTGISGLVRVCCASILYDGCSDLQTIKICTDIEDTYYNFVVSIDVTKNLVSFVSD